MSAGGRGACRLFPIQRETPPDPGTIPTALPWNDFLRFWMIGQSGQWFRCQQPASSPGHLLKFADFHVERCDTVARDTLDVRPPPGAVAPEAGQSFDLCPGRAGAASLVNETQLADIFGGAATIRRGSVSARNEPALLVIAAHPGIARPLQFRAREILAKRAAHSPPGIVQERKDGAFEQTDSLPPEALVRQSGALNLRSRSALPSTKTLDSAIAPAAKTGESRIPWVG